MNFIDLGSYAPTNLSVIKENSRIAIVTDYPSHADIKEGRAFSDAAGTILSVCLNQNGITMSDCSIIYVIPEAQTQGTVHAVWSPKGFTTLGNQYIETLKHNLVKVNANVVLALGELSLQALTYCRSVTKWRGSILSSSIKIDQKIIPAYHPRECIQMYIWRYFLAADCKKLSKEVYSPTIVLPARNLRIEPSFTEAMAWMMSIKLQSIAKIAVDIECIKGRPEVGITCISLAKSPIDCMSIPFDNRWSETEELELWKMLAEILEDRSIEKIYQNGIDFDTVYLLAVHSIFPGGKIQDTMIKHSLNYPDFPKSLAFLTSIYTDEPYYKDDGKEGKIGNSQRAEFYIYNAKDSAVDYEINNKVDEELRKFGNVETYEFLRRLAEPLLYMQLRGVKVNQEGIAKLKDEAELYIKEKQAQLDYIVGERMPLSANAQRKNYYYERLNPNSNKQCQTYLYDILKLKPQTSTKKDGKTGEKKTKVTTDTKALGRLIRMFKCEEAAIIKQIRVTRKLKGTYLEMNIDKDDRLRCQFKLAGTTTGRLSSSATIFGTGSNMQNLPLTFKEFLVPDEGYIFCDLDKAQAEWVASAYIFNDANMIQAVEDKADIHIRTAAMMFKAPEEVIKIEDGYLGGSTDELWIAEQRQKMLEETGINVLQYGPLPNMSMRQSGKKCNHSFNYGLSPTGFSIQYDMPIVFSKKCHQLYHAGYPGIAHGHRRIESEIQSTRTLTNLFGRKRRFMGRLDDNLYKAAYAYKPQSTVGELLNRGIITTYSDQFDPLRREYMRPQEILNQVHDNMLFQYPIRTEEEIENFVRCIMRTKDNLDIPLTANGRTFVIKTDGKIGFNGKHMEKIKLDSFEECLASVKAAIAKLRGDNSNNLNNKVEQLLSEIEELEGEDDELNDDLD